MYKILTWESLSLLSTSTTEMLKHNKNYINQLLYQGINLAHYFRLNIHSPNYFFRHAKNRANRFNLFFSQKWQSSNYKQYEKDLPYLLAYLRILLFLHRDMLGWNCGVFLYQSNEAFQLSLGKPTPTMNSIHLVTSLAFHWVRLMEAVVHKATNRVNQNLLGATD